jgi:predicted enzyme related to lactoylglutathione lyase
MKVSGIFTWHELVTSDRNVCGEFCSTLFGWERHEINMGPHGTYTLFQKSGNEVAGMTDPLTEYARTRAPFWAGYVEVDDVDACAAMVEGLGGKTVAPFQTSQTSDACACSATQTVRPSD